jgi:hypothetical protein
MRDLVRSEWRRFRGLAIGVALAHVFALHLLSRMTDVLQLGLPDQGMMVVVYMLLGLVLAALQVGSYRSTSRWLWLIHRPLAPGRIFTALALSALALLALTVLAPLLLFLVVTHAVGAQVVDSRHYVSAALALAFALMAWLVGAHAATSRHRAAVAVLLAPWMLAFHPASVWALMIPVSVCLAWLFAIARHGFRADRDASIARHGVLLLMALPLQLAFFLLVFQLGKQGIALGKLLTRREPARTVLSTDADADIEARLRDMAHAFFAAGLAGSADPRAAAWREQLPLLRAGGTAPDIERFPVRHQFGNVIRPWWDDERGIQWTFSHDRMRFRGRERQTGAVRGWWGRGGLDAPEPFAEVPVTGMTRTSLFVVDREAQRQHELVRLDEGEWFTGQPVEALDRVLAQTNQRLRVYRRDRGVGGAFAPLVLDWSVDFPAGEPMPIAVDVRELLDGWLVSLFFFDAWEFDGFAFLLDPWQRIVHVGAEGHATVVGERRGIHDHRISLGATSPVPVTSWWASPPLYALAHLPDLLDTGLANPPRFEPLPPVRAFYPVTLALMLASLAAGYGWLRGTRVSAPRRRLWLATCFLIGVPAFLSLVCLEPRTARCA